MADRADQLDPETAAFIDGIEAGITPAASTLSPASARELLDQLFAVDDPEPVASVREFEISGPAEPIPVRIYAPEAEPPHPALVFFHGGGWMRGSLDGYDGLCRLLCTLADVAVVSVDYRLAPEHPFPAGFEDCYAAAVWTAENAADLTFDPDRIAVGGDSGGGNLAAAVALAARDMGGPSIAHQVLIYPAVIAPALEWFDSYDENAEGYLLEMDAVEYYYDEYVGSPAHLGNAYLSPLRARSLAGLPPATVLTAGYDPLRDEGAAYVERLEDAGVPVDHLHYPAQIHAFVSLFEHLDDGRRAIADLAEAFTTGL